MIFITLGSQKFQFNRLLKELDRLVKNKMLTEELYAQIGFSDYEPDSYSYKDFMPRDEFMTRMKQADLIITHGGSGAIINALKSKKKIIAVPRLSDFGEHVDDHQIQIVESFENSGYLLSVQNIYDLINIVEEIQSFPLKEFKTNSDHFIQRLYKYLEET